jgi:hypothetical protein
MRSYHSQLNSTLADKKGKMNTKKLPARIYEAFCPFCNSRIEYPLFASGFGYGFKTYFDITNKIILRVAEEYLIMNKVHPGFAWVPPTYWGFLFPITAPIRIL